MPTLEETCNILQQLQSPEDNVRIKAEEQFTTALIHDAMLAPQLLQITLEPSVPNNIQLAAIVNLKRHINKNWFTESSNENEIIPEDSKNIIKENLFLGLGKEDNKVRSNIASCLASVANFDWPNQFPNFTEKLAAAMKTSDNFNQIDAALKVLVEFSQDISSDFLGEFVNTFFQSLAAIIVEEGRPLMMKQKAVTVFFYAFMLSSECEEKVKKVMARNVEPCIDLVLGVLQSAQNSGDSLNMENPEYYALLSSCMKLSVVLIRHFAKLVLPKIDIIMNSVWTIFTNSVNIYQNSYILKSENDKSLDTETEDGDKVGLSTFLCEVISFLTELVMTKKGQKLIKPLISQVLAVLIGLSQITADSLEEWDDDVECFRQDQEAIMACAYSMSTTSMVRATAQEALLEVMPCEYSNTTRFVEYLYQAVNLALTQHKNCWQIQEAAALTVSGIYELCIETDKKICEKEFIEFFQQICHPALTGNCPNKDINIYTMGRFEICSGKFILWLSPELSTFLLSHVSDSLKNGLMQSKILAIQALHDISEKLKDDPRKDELAPTINDNIQAILALAFEVAKENQENNNTNQDLLSDCLEVLDVLFEVDQNTTSVYSEEVTQFVCILLRTNKSDPLMADSVICLLDKLLANHVPGSADNVVEQLSKVIFDLLTDLSDDDSLTLKATALEALEHIAKEIRKCQDRRAKKPELYSNDSITEEHFVKCVSTSFLPMMQLVLNSDYSTDSQIIENATSVCKSIFSCKYGSQIMLTLKDEQNNRIYIEYVLQLIQMALDPKMCESGAASIGKLINVMILKCGAQLQENGSINQILSLVLTKLTNVQTMSIYQTLLLVFGQLMCENVEAVMKILENSGVEATKLLLSTFVDKFPDFFGFLERKIGAIALINLLKYLTSTNNQAIMSMEVNGEIIVEPNCARMVTRSKAKTEPVKYRQIPFILKLYKVLLQECSSQIDRKTNNFNELTQSNGSDDDEWVEDDDDLECLDENDSFSANQVLDGCLNLIDDDEDFYDEFEKQDNPFGDVDSLEYLGNVFKEIKADAGIFQQFGDEEMKAVGYFGLI